jgi:protoporphyrinogen oxidase
MKSRHLIHPKPRRVTRRTFLAAAAITTAAACATPYLRKAAPRRFTGGIVGANSSLGHAMRDGKFPAVSESAETGIVIVGGGIGGLAAARQLQRNGLTDFTLLELETRPGGNAQSGRNEISAYPWGAHYVPISGNDTIEVTKLFEELGIIQGRDATGLPVYNEEYLCADPMERLFIHGRWQEGFVPQLGNTDADQLAIDSFFAEMQRFKSARGRDNRRAFTIPLDESSRDEEFTQFDKMTMADYLRQKGWFKSVPLRWYVNYCCRDDYGAGLEKISAWAGIHYFASRDAVAANAPNYAVLTWPEGNGWLVRQLQTQIDAHIRNSSAVWNIESAGDQLLVDYYDVTRQKSIRLQARGVIWAAPYFVARRVIVSLRGQPADASAAVYSPWLVANLTLDALPTDKGMDVAWDNVIYDNDSLGYVVATHQIPERVPVKTVITYYHPLDAEEPSIARQQALARSYDDWCDMIVANLSQGHPDIARHTKHMDVWLWGHGMVRPVPGYIWGPTRARMQEPLGKIVFVNSDVSGISIFEEAYTRGVRAANHLVQNFGQTSIIS